MKQNPKRNRYMTMVLQQMLDDLTYPVNQDGAVMDTSAIKAWVCWHLVRCGWRKPNNLDGLALIEDYDDPVIKKRRLIAPGVVEDAITWVPADSSDPLEDLENMTIAQVEALPPELKHEAKVRLGMIPADPSRGDPAPPAWEVQPHITIVDEPDTEDGRRWV